MTADKSVPPEQVTPASGLRSRASMICVGDGRLMAAAGQIVVATDTPSRQSVRVLRDRRGGIDEFGARLGRRQSSRSAVLGSDLANCRVGRRSDRFVPTRACSPCVLVPAHLLALPLVLHGPHGVGAGRPAPRAMLIGFLFELPLIVRAIAGRPPLRLIPVELLKP
jgi:hypothetical protein